jgi:hypothetical protein
VTQPSEVMISRLAPEPGAPAPAASAPSRGPEFLIEILAPSDGAPLLRMFERGGRLAVEYDDSRLEEGARAFVHEMMRWSGLAGIDWKNEAKAAG